MQLLCRTAHRTWPQVSIRYRIEYSAQALLTSRIAGRTSLQLRLLFCSSGRSIPCYLYCYQAEGGNLLRGGHAPRPHIDRLCGGALQAFAQGIPSTSPFSVWYDSSAIRTLFDFQ